MEIPKYKDFASIVIPHIINNKVLIVCDFIIPKHITDEQTTIRLDSKELRELANYLDSIKKGQNET